MISLTRRQRDLLDFIVGYQASHRGTSPSYDEMTAGLGIRSKGNVAGLMAGLEERGWVRRKPHGVRAIEVLGEGDMVRASLEEVLSFYISATCGHPDDEVRNAVIARARAALVEKDASQ